MVRHNNRILKNHFRFHWHPEAAQKGHVKVCLGQAKGAQRRKERRILKAKSVFPRPIDMLRPVARCETVRYNMKRRDGRGFTAAELKSVGLTARLASTVGIAIDKRRSSQSEEAMQANVERLKAYLAKLVVVKKGKVGKNMPFTVAPPSSLSEAKQLDISKVLSEADKVVAEPPRALTEVEKKRLNFAYLRKCYRDSYLVGQREVRARKKAEKEAEEAAKKK
ncbi:60S ribosomal protein L13 [Perkinsela sp. CCAP 1560/4]|nr:60S ribosomal protein L13 [Perkinsela sp. CCAP 1560/4]|eukprot:KNH07938.1 60S ribosomal protein L13 [Perkinsela sp. CCAP 1560/4]